MTMTAATERLAARHGCRQVEAALRAGRAADAASRAVAKGWAELLRVLRAAPSPSRAQHHVLPLLHALPLLAIRAAAAELAKQVVWGHRSARTNIAYEIPRNILRRLAYRRSGVRRHLRESADWLDLFAPLRDPLADAGHVDILALLFPPPSESRVNRIVFASGWQDRIRSGTGLASPEALASRIAVGMIAGKTHREIARDILPAVQRVQSAAKRIARTESMRVAAAVQMDAHAGLGDLVAGYQVHATLDERTRPEHRARDGTIYWAEPKAGQPGYGEMPHPPQEADGSVAWNCRCWLSPVLREPGAGEGAAHLTPPPSPDPLVYSDWFATAGERRRRLAVGTRRYDAAREASGEDRPGWEHFVDLATGKLLPLDVIRGEAAGARGERLAATRAALAARREAKRRVIGFGFAWAT